MKKKQGCLCRLLCPNVPLSGDEEAFSLQVQGGDPSQGRHISCFQEDSGSLYWLFLKKLLIQSNQYAKLAYSGVTYPEPHQK